MNEEKPYTQRTTVLSLESVADVNIPWEQMQKIVKVAGALQDGEAVTVWKVAVQRMGEIVRVLPQVPGPCPKCGMVPGYQTDWFKKCVEVRCHQCGRHVDGPNAVEAVWEWNEQAEDERTGSVIDEAVRKDVALPIPHAERLANVLSEAAEEIVQENTYRAFDACAHYQIIRLRYYETFIRWRLGGCQGEEPPRLRRNWKLMRLFEDGARWDFQKCVEHGLSPEGLDEIRKDPEKFVAQYPEGSTARDVAQKLVDDIC